jgi:acetoacetyl-CoA reductase
VTVNVICPGYVATKMVMAIKPEVLQTIIDTVPMKRLAKPEEIGGACAYLASELAGLHDRRDDEHQWWSVLPVK